MSNRHRIRRVPVPAEVRRALRCQDCSGDVTPVAHVVGGVVHVEISHDASCWWFNRHGGGRPFSIINPAPRQVRS